MTIKYNKGMRFMKKLLICAILCTISLVSCTTKSVIEEPIVEQTKVDTATNVEEQLKEETEEEQVKEEIVTEQAKEIVEEQKDEVSEICVSPGDIEIIGGKTKADWIYELNAIFDNFKAEHEDIYASGVTATMLQALSTEYAEWDSKLNEIYNLILEQLNQYDQDNLINKEVDWIANRDRLVELEASKYAGGTMERTVRMERLVSLTRDRCYELLKYYMK